MTDLFDGSQLGCFCGLSLSVAGRTSLFCLVPAIPSVTAIYNFPQTQAFSLQSLSLMLGAEQALMPSRTLVQVGSYHSPPLEKLQKFSFIRFIIQSNKSAIPSLR
jgi:hypothetical protein